DLGSADQDIDARVVVGHLAMRKVSLFAIRELHFESEPFGAQFLDRRDENRVDAFEVLDRRCPTAMADPANAKRSRPYRVEALEISRLEESEVHSIRDHGAWRWISRNTLVDPSQAVG